LPESYQGNYLTCAESIQISLNHFTLYLWSPGSVKIWSDAYQSSYHLHSSSGLSISCLNRFMLLVNRFTMLFLAKILHFPSFSIYSHFLITPKILNHLHQFSLESPNLIVRTFFNIKHFFLESLVIWVIDYGSDIWMVSWFIQGNLLGKSWF